MLILLSGKADAYKSPLARPSFFLSHQSTMPDLSTTSTTPPTATLSTQTDPNDLLPGTSLLALPLEVVGMILDHSFTHPETQAMEANQYGVDMRSHGWNNAYTSLKQMSE